MSSILIVEDDAMLRSALIRVLTNAGWDVHEASDGVDGVHMALKIMPAIILADIVMPNKNGIEMVGEIRENNWGKNAFIVMLTNSDQEKDLVDSLNVNADIYLRKTELDINELPSKLQGLLSSKDK